MGIGTIPEKIPNIGEGSGLEILGGYIEKAYCNNSRGQLKKEVAFPGVIKKVLVFGPGSSVGCNTIFPGLRGEASFCLEFLRIK